MSKYEKLDAAILSSIGGHPKRASAILVGVVKQECDRIAEEDRKDGSRHAHFTCVLDRRLQALKRAGKIKAKINVGWTRVEAKA